MKNLLDGHKTISKNFIEPKILSIKDRLYLDPLNIEFRFIIPLILVLYLIPISIILILLQNIFTPLGRVERFPSYSESTNCVYGDFYFPQLLYSNNKNFTLFSKNALKFRSIQLHTNQLCVRQEEVLAENVIYSIDIYQIPIFVPKIRFLVETSPYSFVGMKSGEVAGVNISAPISFTKSGGEDGFKYVVSLNGIDQECTIKRSSVICDIEKYGLEQGRKYEYMISSIYQDKIYELLDSGYVRTLKPISLVNTSVSNIDQIYEKRPQITIEMSKEVGDARNILISNANSPQRLESEIKIEKNRILLSPLTDLEKNSIYNISIRNVEGKDGSFLAKPIEISFKTANGPKLISTNLSQGGFPAWSNIILTFDQELAQQDVKKLLKISKGTEYTYYIDGKSITLDPVSNLQYCQKGNIELSPGLVNQYGTSYDQASNIAFRTDCARVASIGTSVRGRPIYAYYFGNGSKKIIYFGAMHGSESNSKVLLRGWIDELEKGYQNIPTDKTVIVVPTINPDGIAASERFNSNGVDINRNFGSSDWKKETYFLNKLYPNGGGSAPFSEPESIAIRNLITSNSPYLVLSYHSAAGYVVSNGYSIANTFGKTYASTASYSYIPPSNDTAFEYSITGSFGQWASEVGYPSLTIELANWYSAEESRNFPAMWKMLK